MLDYRDIFSTKDEPLGHTDVVRHDIKMSGPPIKSHYRQVPIGLKEETIQEEQRMKQLGVIELSESPWAATDVLVRVEGWKTALLHRLLQAEPGHTEGQLSLAQYTRLLGWLGWSQVFFHP